MKKEEKSKEKKFNNTQKVLFRCANIKYTSKAYLQVSIELLTFLLN